MSALSKRLSVIASLVPSGARVCDIGTDHAYLGIELIKSGKATSVIACDINEKPLLKAKSNIEKSGVTGIELRLRDGLSGLKPSETDCIVIAGIGGEVISGIFERTNIFSQEYSPAIILQPTTSPEILRKFLCENGFSIKKEIPILDNGKLYTAMLVFFTGQNKTYDEYYYYIGSLNPKDDTARLYIEKQYNRCFKCMTALKNTENRDEYLYYKDICEKIENYLKES